MRVALDTNVLAYAEGVNGSSMKNRALDLVKCLPPGSVVLPAQTLGELFQVLVRKAGRPTANARAAVLSWRTAFPVFPTSAGTVLMATDLVVNHSFSFWDAVVLTAASQAECQLLLSEDMQDGFVWQGVTIANPFATAKHPLLKAPMNPA
jgi:predicted nucleic acid-binding protein